MTFSLFFQKFCLVGLGMVKVGNSMQKVVAKMTPYHARWARVLTNSCTGKEIRCGKGEVHLQARQKHTGVFRTLSCQLCTFNKIRVSPSLQFFTLEINLNTKVAGGSVRLSLIFCKVNLQVVWHAWTSSLEGEYQALSVHGELTHTLVSLGDGWGNINKNLPLFLSLLIRISISLY
jgi:hypothetical protein